MRRKHRIIIEKILGRKLSSNEVVHHKDGDIDNGNIENLQLLSRPAHSSLHMVGRTIPECTKKKLQAQSRKARPGAKLSIEDVRDIRKMLRDKIKHRLIGFAFDVHRKTITSINIGDTWGWLL